MFFSIDDGIRFQLSLFILKGKYMNNYPISRKANIVVQELESELLVYDLSINKAFCLNKTSALVYHLCDGRRTVEGIRNELSERLKMLINEDLIWLALDGLKKDNLLENSERFEIDFDGLSRRQIIRRIGLASMVLLPSVSSLIAPSAAMAQSGPTNLGLTAACTSPLQCTSGNCFNNTKCCVPGTVRGVNPGDFIMANAGVGGTCATISRAALDTACSTIFTSTICCSGNPLVSDGGCVQTLPTLVSTPCLCT